MATTQEQRRGGRGLSVLADVVAAAALVVAAFRGTRRHTRDALELEPIVADAKPAGRAPGWLRALDQFQRRHTIPAFAFAVVKKFGDDRAGRLAALIAYYAFFSLFPLLLVAVTVIAFVLDEEQAADFEDSALAQIPVVGDQIASQIGGLEGSIPALVIGSVTALWAGLGAMQSAQDAMNEVWGVPRVEQPNFFLKRARSLTMLAVVGFGLLIGTGSTQLATLAPEGSWARLVGGIATAGVNIVVFWVAFQVLIFAKQPWRALLPGAVAAGIAYTLLQYLGQVYVQRTIAGASDTYGTFAVVIGLLSYLYLFAQLLILCAEISAVSHRRLWPRGLTQEAPTAADREIATMAVRAARTRPDTRLRMGFPDRDEPDPPRDH